MQGKLEYVNNLINNIFSFDFIEIDYLKIFTDYIFLFLLFS